MGVGCLKVSIPLAVPAHRKHEKSVTTNRRDGIMEFATERGAAGQCGECHTPQAPRPDAPEYTHMATVCTTTRETFAREARPLTVEVKDHNGRVVYMGVLLPKDTTDTAKSLGWTGNAKGVAPVGGLETPAVQIGINVTLIGSKPA